MGKSRGRRGRRALSGVKEGGFPGTWCLSKGLGVRGAVETRGKEGVDSGATEELSAEHYQQYRRTSLKPCGGRDKGQRVKRRLE